MSYLSQANLKLDNEIQGSISMGGKCNMMRRRWQQNNDKMITEVKERGAVGIYNSRVENSGMHHTAEM